MEGDKMQSERQKVCQETVLGFLRLTSSTSPACVSTELVAWLSNIWCVVSPKNSALLPTFEQFRPGAMLERGGNVTPLPVSHLEHIQSLPLI